MLCDYQFRNRGRILNCNRDEFVREEAYFKSCKSDYFLCLGLSDVDEEIEDIFKGVYDFLHKRRVVILR